MSSNCFSDNDGTWPNNTAYLLALASPYRPAVARVWHGMLLAAATFNKPGASGPMLAYVYDPYARAYAGTGPLSLVPISLGTAAGAPAIWYADLTAWLFYSDGNSLLCQGAPQPGLSSQTNQILFTSFEFAPATIAAANVVANSPAAILFNGQVYVFWTSATAAINYVSAPYAPRSSLQFGPVQTLIASGVLSEPSVAVWQDRLYVAYREQGGVQVVAGTAAGPGFLLESITTQWMQSCGNLNCNFAPALAADPKGTFLMMVFCQPGGKQLCTTYLIPGYDQWTAPQLIQHQSTGVSPSVITTGGNYGYLAYVVENGKGTNISTSIALPPIQPGPG
jgi:hypothetical protein